MANKSRYISFCQLTQFSSACLSERAGSSASGKWSARYLINVQRPQHRTCFYQTKTKQKQKPKNKKRCSNSLAKQTNKPYNSERTTKKNIVALIKRFIYRSHAWFMNRNVCAIDETAVAIIGLKKPMYIFFSSSNRVCMCVWAVVKCVSVSMCFFLSVYVFRLKNVERL